MKRGIAAAVLCMTALACTAPDPASVTRAQRPRQGHTVAGKRISHDDFAATSDWARLACRLPAAHVRRIERGYFPGRSPDLVLVPKARNFSGSFTVTSHSGPSGYLQRVPLAFYGPGYIRSRGDLAAKRDMTVADNAPTLAELLGMKWPGDRGGKPIREALLPAAQRTDPPALIVVVVWDGGGWNVLNRWRRAWPNLERLTREGVSITDATVGSSPSVTPAIHSTIGTGAFPAQHGVVDIPVRRKDRMIGSFRGRSPRNLALATVGDLWDKATNNRARVGMYAEHSWHLGMLGHGGFYPRADRDPAVLITNEGTATTNARYFSLPSYVKEVGGLAVDAKAVDGSDGELDGMWMDHPLLGDVRDIRTTPAAMLYQTRVIKNLISKEGFGADRVPDLFFTNYKQIDFIGHAFNMLNPEVREAVEVADEELGELVEFLDHEVGKERWVLALTADHGQQPDAQAIGAWPYNVTYVANDLAEHFGLDKETLIEEERPTGLWLDKKVLRRAGGTLGEAADFLLGNRIRDNLAPGQEVPAQYADRLEERIFRAVFPAARVARVAACAGSRRN